MFGITKKPKRVYVLGAGPAGLLAAHAAAAKGYDVQVFSKPDLSGKAAKSDLYGCQYLHADIPGLLGGPGRTVRYTVDGPSDGYRRKVYGASWNGSVSTDEYGPEQTHLAWDLRSAYDSLWDIYGDSVYPMDITPQRAGSFYADPEGYVLNTIPLPALCRDMENHKFVSQQVYAMGTRGVHHAQLRALPFTAPDDTIVCNGWRDTAWYRAATVFGYSTLEWPGGKKPPISGVVAVSKPLSTDCTCWQNDRSTRLGRFGTWTKGVLVHTAYFETMKALP